MKTPYKIEITFDLKLETARLTANAELTTGEFATASSMLLKAAIKTGSDYGCPGCTAALSRLRAAFSLVDSALSSGDAPMGEPTLAGPVAGRC